MSVAVARRADTSRGSRSRYTPPSDVQQVTFEHLIDELGLPKLESNQLSLIAGGQRSSADFPIWLAGNIDVLRSARRAGIREGGRPLFEGTAVVRCCAAPHVADLIRASAPVPARLQLGSAKSRSAASDLGEWRPRQRAPTI